VAIFTDDFDRADGSPGANWTAASNAITISSGALTGTSTWQAIANTVTDANRIEAYGTFLFPSSYATQQRLLVKTTIGAGQCYTCYVTVVTGTYYFYLTSGAIGGGATLASANLGTVQPTVYTMRLVWDYGTITATLNGGNTLTATDTTYAANLYSGITGNTTACRCLSFGAIGGQAVGLSVDPGIIGNYGACTEVTLTGTGTNWTPGTPGSPTFTVNHGTISTQTVDSATSARITVCPGDYLGAIIITDPTTGQQTAITVTSDPAIVPPTGGGDTWSPYKTLVDATGTLFDPDYLLTDKTPIIPGTEEVPGDLTILPALQHMYIQLLGGWNGTPPTGQIDLLNTLWRVLNGHNDLRAEYDLPYDEPVATTLKKALDVWLKPDLSLWTVGEVVNTLGGTTLLYNHQQLYDAIQAISTGSNEDVLAALAAYWGEGAPTILQLALMIEGISTPAGYTLADVLDAISGISAPDLSAIAAKLDAIQPNTDYTLTTLTLRMADLQNDMTAVLDQLDTIQALIENLPTAEAPTVAPVWPGVANVTLGAPVALTDQLVLEGPMHGVLVSVTTPPTRTGLRQIGGHLMDYGVGEVAFMADNGYIEPWVYMGFRTAIFTPKSMASADGALFRVLAGAGGTARTWVRS
jgi:hypothetical protein